MPRDIRDLNHFPDFPQAHHFGVYKCPSCPNAHIVLFDDEDTPIAQFVIGRRNQQRLLVDTNEVFDHDH